MPQHPADFSSLLWLFMPLMLGRYFLFAAFLLLVFCYIISFV